jgi:hypothetical protein
MCPVPVPFATVKLETDTFTVTLVVNGLYIVAFVGDVIDTDGEVEQIFVAVAEFLGVGAPTVKSVLLELLSVHPPFILMAAVVFDKTATAAVPSKADPVPYPTKSIYVPAVKVVPTNAVAELTKATFPFVPDKFIGDTVTSKSGVGKATPIVLAASFIKKYFPGAIDVAAGIVFTDHAVPVADAY